MRGLLLFFVFILCLDHIAWEKFKICEGHNKVKNRMFFSFGATTCSITTLCRTTPRKNKQHSKFTAALYHLEECYSAEFHSDYCHWTEGNSTECHSAECHSVKCHSAECHSAECHSVKCHSAECHSAGCHSAGCHFAEYHFR